MFLKIHQWLQKRRYAKRQRKFIIWLNQKTKDKNYINFGDHAELTTYDITQSIMNMLMQHDSGIACLAATAEHALETFAFEAGFEKVNQMHSIELGSPFFYRRKEKSKNKTKPKAKIVPLRQRQ